MVVLVVVVEEEEETAAGWRSPEMTEIGPNRCRVTNALNSESGFGIRDGDILKTGKTGSSTLQGRFSLN